MNGRKRPTLGQCLESLFCSRAVDLLATTDVRRGLLHRLGRRSRELENRRESGLLRQHLQEMVHCEEGVVLRSSAGVALEAWPAEGRVTYLVKHRFLGIANDRRELGRKAHVVGTGVLHR